MKSELVIKYFGSLSKTGRALGISRQAVSRWPDLVPIGRAYQIEVVTKGELKVDPSVYMEAA